MAIEPVSFSMNGKALNLILEFMEKFEGTYATLIIRKSQDKTQKFGHLTFSLDMKDFNRAAKEKLREEKEKP